MQTQEQVLTTAPWHIWLIGVVGLIWYFFGFLNFYASYVRDPADLTSFNQATHDFFAAAPVWYFAAWFLAELFGFVGAGLLLFKSAHAVTLFILAIIAIFANMISQFRNCQCVSGDG